MEEEALVAPFGQADSGPTKLSDYRFFGEDFFEKSHGWNAGRAPRLNICGADIPFNSTFNFTSGDPNLWGITT
jgi:hypothetical protein